MKNGLQAFISGGEYDVDMFNSISSGKNRAMRKKIRRLEKRGVTDKDEVFKRVQDVKSRVARTHEKVIFNDVKELKLRREKRVKREESNKKKFKNQIEH